MTKAELIERIELIARKNVEGWERYDYEVIVSDWQNYGKDRTYFKIAEKSTGASKHYVVKDYGYIDNKTGEYHPNKYADLTANYTFHGDGFTTDETTTETNENTEMTDNEKQLKETQEKENAKRDELVERINKIVAMSQQEVGEEFEVKADIQSQFYGSYDAQCVEFKIIATLKGTIKSKVMDYGVLNLKTLEYNPNEPFNLMNNMTITGKQFD